ncbi:MAG: ExeM/NucH family extracellular endonuclease [Xanthomonadales bacterium]|nr:ExeM/NucH family extracellular endonuclease [Xanthomonadales bacterium]
MTASKFCARGLAVTPGLLLFLLLLSGCREDTAPTAIAGDPVLCKAKSVTIARVQGKDWRSPLEGSQQSVDGVVTAVEEDEGFYLEEVGETEPGASRALFVATPELAPHAEPGQHWFVTGTVKERGSSRDTLTSVADLQAFAVCAEGLPLPNTSATLPLSSVQRETLEGMRLTFDQDFFVSDVYQHHRGTVSLSIGEDLRSATEDGPPGEAAARTNRENRERTLATHLPSPVETPLAVGSRAGTVLGVFGHDGRNAVLLAEDVNKLEPRNPPKPFPAAADGDIRVVIANLLNFFNGDGRGDGFPAERGARSLEEFERQQERTAAVMAQLRPDLLAVQELENDGYGPQSAAASLLKVLEGGTREDYAAIEAPGGDYLGNDVISVGLFYRKSTLEPVGRPHTLTAEPFLERSRQPLAQVFRDLASGETFLVAVNHLKSKGSCPDDGPNRNRRDGQGCWNVVRAESVNELLPWLKELASATSTDKVLVVGDMNAYRREDPIERFRAGGFTELVETLSGLPQYSVRFYGQAGTLDYAFASPALAALASRADIWPVNADWPPRMDLPRPWLRMSDHDPVIVDFDFQNRP